MAQDFLEWAQTNDEQVTIDTSGKTGLAAFGRSARKAARGTLGLFRPSPFLTDNPRGYQPMYSWAEEVLRPPS